MAQFNDMKTESSQATAWKEFMGGNPILAAQRDAETMMRERWAKDLNLAAIPKTPIKSDVIPRAIRDTSHISDLSAGEFRMGIEFEGLVRHEIYDQFVESMTALSVRQCDGESNISFGDDESIKTIPAGFVAVEIRTLAMRWPVAISLLERMLCFLWLASQTDDWRTNACCGLHLNISEKGVFKSGDQVDFYCHILKEFDESSILTTFNRVGNKYCLPFFKDGAARDIDSIKHQYNLCKRRERAALASHGDCRAARESKYFSVSLRDSPVHDDYQGEHRANTRIEFRCIGNEDYHLRFDDLDTSINHMIDCVRAAYSAVA